MSKGDPGAERESYTVGSETSETAKGGPLRKTEIAPADWKQGERQRREQGRSGGIRRPAPPGPVGGG